MTGYRELLIGCGHSREKRLDPREFLHWTGEAADLRQWRGGCESLDYMIECRPDLVCNLQRVPWSVLRRVGHEWLELGEVLEDSAYDEVHAYEVLEHLGQQGDYRSFFSTFSEIWRVLKPGGYLCATVPSRYSPWLWGDPGHTRAILPASLVFLNQPNYDAQQGKTSMSDYRREYRADFDITGSVDDHTTHKFVLQCVKPSRVTLS